MILVSLKSISLIVRSSLSIRRIFSGLISRHTMFRSCYVGSVNICETDQVEESYQVLDGLEYLEEDFACLLFAELLLFNNQVEKLKSSPAGASSKTRYTAACSSKVSFAYSMFGWLILMKIAISCCKESIFD